MIKEEIRARLNLNKTLLEHVENRLSGGFNQADGEGEWGEEGLFAAHERLTTERDVLMQMLSLVSAEQSNTSRNRHGIFTLNRTLSVPPNSPEPLLCQCESIAQDMTKELIEQYECGEITQAMYDHAHDAINYELQFFNVTTTEQFITQIKAAIDQGLSQARTASYAP